MNKMYIIKYKQDWVQGNIDFLAENEEDARLQFKAWFRVFHADQVTPEILKVVCDD